MRGALDNRRGMQSNVDTLALSSCQLVDSEEAWQDDAYVQQLIFSVKV
jgi:hypothetical protein